jgi:hypothetical protein
MTKTLVQRDAQVDEDRLYVPPWVRNSDVPVVREHPARAPNLVRATDLPSPNLAARVRMPKGIGGPNLECPPPLQHERVITGDRLLSPLSYEPDDVPEPVRRPSKAARWAGRLTVLVLVASIAAYGLTIVTSRNWTVGVSSLDEPAIDSVASAINNPPSQQRPTTPRLTVEHRRAYINEPLLLGLSLEGATGGEFLLLKGLEAATRLSAGKFLEPNSWRISVFELGNLFAYAPKDYVGTMEAVVDLHSADDSRVDSQVIRMEWVALAGRSGPSSSSDRPLVSQEPVAQLPLHADETAMLLRRGYDLLKLGDITAARIALRRAANAGNSDAAFMLASTFDPNVLRQIGAIGIAPDPRQALYWYEKASELGSGEAKRGIERLGNAIMR